MLLLIVNPEHSLNILFELLLLIRRLLGVDVPILLLWRRRRLFHEMSPSAWVSTLKV
jgi:hypothetical protein